MKSFFMNPDNSMASSSSTTFSSTRAPERGPYQTVSSDVKRRLVSAWEEGQDYVQAARILDIKLSTARSIIKRYQRGESFEDKRGGLREQALKLTPTVVQEIVDLVERHPDFTLEQIRQALGTPLSLSSVSRALDGQLITMKKLEDCPARRNAVDVKEARAEYAEWYLDEGISKTIIYIDESSFNIFTKRTRGRAPVGRRAVRQVGGQRGPNLNLIVAISSGVGVVYFEQHRGSVNGERFQHFMDNLESVLRSTEVMNPVLVMDNAPIHNGSSCGEFPIRRLPAYRPFLILLKMHLVFSN